MGNKLKIELKNVYKKYTITHNSPENNVKNLFRDFSILHKNTENYTALNDINIEINEGERVGIIGSNGAGKTTLLNIIGGFAEQSEGQVTVNGKINAIMTLGVGIREELTGIENIYTEGELQGKSKSEIDVFINGIIEFADIGEYINKPVRTYSSGMKARLSFAMLSFIEPEILIIDEILGVGDADFAAKSAKKIQELCAKGKILIVVSHSMGTITSMTDRTLWMEDGKVVMDGSSLEVTRAYLDSVRKREEEELNKNLSYRIENSKIANEILIEELFLSSDKRKSIFEVFENVKINFKIEALEDIIFWDVKLSLYKIDGTLIMENYASNDGIKLKPLKKEQKKEFGVFLEKIAFSEGLYEIICEILDNSKDVIARESTALKIENLTIFMPSKPDYFCKYEIFKG